MLKMSEADLQYGRTIAQYELVKNDLEWLKGQ